MGSRFASLLTIKKLLTTRNQSLMINLARMAATLESLDLVEEKTIDSAAIADLLRSGG